MPEQQQSKTGRLQPFTVEFGDERCGTITINLFRRRVRGRWSIAQLHSRKGGGRDYGKMNAMPDIPGIHMRVESGKATIYDPLDSDDREMVELKEQIVSVMNRAQVGQADRVKVVETTEESLTEDQLKTLLLEVIRKVKDEPTCARLVKGALPTVEQVFNMPGRQLNDPWNTNPRKPRYKDQVEAYEVELDQRGVV